MKLVQLWGSLAQFLSFLVLVLFVLRSFKVFSSQGKTTTQEQHPLLIPGRARLFRADAFACSLSHISVLQIVGLR